MLAKVFVRGTEAWARFFRKILLQVPEQEGTRSNREKTRERLRSSFHVAGAENTDGSL